MKIDANPLTMPKSRLTISNETGSCEIVPLAWNHKINSDGVPAEITLKFRFADKKMKVFGDPPFESVD